MWIYILKRILYFIPAFFVISLLAFFITRSSPVDPIDQLVSTTSPNNATDIHSTYLDQKRQLRHKYGLDQPMFYVSLGTAADCDTLHRIPDKLIRENLDHFTHLYGNWEFISNYYQSLLQAFETVSRPLINNETKRFGEDIAGLRTKVMSEYLMLLRISNDEHIRKHFRAIRNELNASSPAEWLADLENCETGYTAMLQNTSRWKLYIPSLRWNGLANQYHEWLFGSGDETSGTGGLINGDLGKSISNGRDISTDIFRKFRLSVELVIVSIVLAYLVSIPIGMFAAYRRNSLFDKGSGIVLFILYSLPNFFVGLLLIHYFANPENFEWFNGAGYKGPDIPYATYYGKWTYPERLAHSLPYMILPIATYFYAQLAFISRLTRSALLNELGNDYIQTARAKGLSERRVIFKHALRNSLLPIITVFVNIFPLAVGGSVIVETIFDYEGMGKEIFTAIKSNDYPVIINFFCLAGLLTMTGYLTADILYALVDPRLRNKKGVPR